MDVARTKTIERRRQKNVSLNEQYAAHDQFGIASALQFHPYSHQGDRDECPQQLHQNAFGFLRVSYQGTSAGLGMLLGDLVLAIRVERGAFLHRS